MAGAGDEAAWCGVSAQHGRRLGSKGSAGVGTGLRFPSAEAGEGGVIPLFVLGSWSDRNWSGGGVQQASSSGGLVPLPALTDPAANPGTEGRAGPGSIQGLQWPDPGPTKMCQVGESGSGVVIAMGGCPSAVRGSSAAFLQGN